MFQLLGVVVEVAAVVRFPTTGASAALFGKFAWCERAVNAEGGAVRAGRCVREEFRKQFK